MGILHRKIGFVGVLLLLFGAGCTKREPEPSPPTDIKLIDAGAEPRSRIRYQVAPGSEQKTTLTLVSDMDLVMNGVERPKQRFPGQRMTLNLEVTEVTSDGIRYDFSLSDVELIETEGVAEPVARSLGVEVAKLVGLGGHAHVSDRGVLKSARFSDGDSFDPMVRQMIDGISQSLLQASSPLPEEAVGVGARWEVTTDLTLNGILISQTTICELVESDRNRVRLKATIRQRANSQDIELVGLAPGTLTRLNSLTASGEGEIEIDTNLIVPVASRVEISSETDLTIGPGDHGQRMLTRLNTKVRMARP